MTAWGGRDGAAVAGVVAAAEVGPGEPVGVERVRRRAGSAPPRAASERLALRQDMAISREAFVRNLPGAVAHVPYRVQGDEFLHGDAARGWRIRLSRLPDRSIALLVLERHAVEIWLRGYDAADERAFLDRFDLYFRRGGG